MGTRSMLVFSENSLTRLSDNETKINEVENRKIKKGIPIYKHWDGYPSNVLFMLRQYLWINRHRLHDISYLSAGFLRYIQEYDYAEAIDEKFLNLEDDDSFEAMELKDHYTGYGLYEQRIKKSFFQGWEEYYYKITPSRIYCYTGHKRDERYRPILIWECEMDKFLELPRNSDYFENLERELSKIERELYEDD